MDATIMVKVWHRYDDEDGKPVFDFVFGGTAFIDPYNEAHLIFDTDALDSVKRIISEENETSVVRDVGDGGKDASPEQPVL